LDNFSDDDTNKLQNETDSSGKYDKEFDLGLQQTVREGPLEVINPFQYSNYTENFNRKYSYYQHDSMTKETYASTDNARKFRDGMTEDFYSSGITSQFRDGWYWAKDEGDLAILQTCSM